MNTSKKFTIEITLNITVSAFMVVTIRQTFTKYNAYLLYMTVIVPCWPKSD